MSTAAPRVGHPDRRGPQAPVSIGAEAGPLAEDGAQTSAGARVPRPHQVEAMNALDTTLAKWARAQLVMACGTGKTLVGRWYAQRVRSAVTVVVVPSLSLVAQTLQEWRSAQDWPFEALITCSDPTTADGERERISGDGQDVCEPFWAGLRARVTTSAGVVAQRLMGHTAEQPLVIFSTYHSVHVVAQAARSARVAVDLLIADEAHTLAGRPRPEFRVVLGDELPAKARIFMTATRVVTSASSAAHGFDDWSAPLSMDDEQLFGPVAYRLDFADAIARNLLADYRVVVYETAGDSVAPDPVAALTTAAGEGVSSVLSFHGRVAKARAFAAAIDGLTLSDGRTVVARAVAGVDPTRQRAQALSLLTSARPDQLVVIASARCLSAGVDIPAVDGVLFADPKYSDVDVVQSVGRALRPSPGKQVGLVMIPVCVPAGIDEDTALSTGTFAAVWRILRGLRSMDRRLAQELEVLARQPSRRGVCDGSRLSRVRFDLQSLTDPARLHVRVVDFLSPAWDQTFYELEAFAEQHGHSRPSRGTRLGEWCERQRRAYRSQMLAEDRAQRLQQLPGWAWDLAEQRWLDQWVQVFDHASRAGGLAVDDPASAAVALAVCEPKSRITTIGRWCAWQRQLARRGELPDRRRDKIAEIPGWSWDPVAPSDAQAVDLLGEYVAWKGHANPPADVVEDDIALGRWLNDVRRRRATGRLAQSLLDEITIVCPASTADGALRWYHAETMWLLGLEALHQFVAREHHCRPPYEHVEHLPDIAIPLYDWCTRQRHFYRHGQLHPARARKLQAVAGWQWERQPAPRVLLDIGDARHGTRTGYVKGCRCDDCTHANRAEAAERAARAASGGPTTDLVDAAAARHHLKVLSAQGATQKSLARACGLNVKTVVQIMSGETLRILPETDEAVLAVSMAEVRSAVAPGTRVDAAATWALLNDMIARGWPKAWIARELGMGNALQLRTDTVTARNAGKVAELARRLGDRRPPKRRARQPLPPLRDLLDSTDPVTAGLDSDAVQWARSLLAQGYHIARVAQRSGLSVAVVRALADAGDGDADEERTAS